MYERELNEDEREAFKVGAIVLAVASFLILVLTFFLGIKIGKKGKTVEQKAENGEVAGQEEIQTEPIPKSESLTEPSPEENTAPETDYFEYTVSSGDTLYGIAQKYNLEWKEIAELNGISDQGTLRVGDKLKIPKK